MRPKVLAVIGLLLAASMALLWVAERKSGGAGPLAVTAGPVAQLDRPVHSLAEISPAIPLTNDPNSIGDAGLTPAPPVQTVIADETQIEQWLESRGPDALPGLLGKLDSGSPEVRGNALEALKQLGDRQAIPVLQQKAEAMTDPAEKARFLAAADFLAMPKYGEK